MSNDLWILWTFDKVRIIDFKTTSLLYFLHFMIYIPWLLSGSFLEQWLWPRFHRQWSPIFLIFPPHDPESINHWHEGMFSLKDRYTNLVEFLLAIPSVILKVDRVFKIIIHIEIISRSWQDLTSWHHLDLEDTPRNQRAEIIND